jgi:hypothetical protein
MFFSELKGSADARNPKQGRSKAWVRSRVRDYIGVQEKRRGFKKKKAGRIYPLL